MRQVLKEFECKEEKRMTFKEGYRLFEIGKLAKNCSDYTLRYYDNGIYYFYDKAGFKYVDEMTEDALNTLIVKERSEHPTQSIRTINTKIMAIRTFLYWSMDRGYLPKYKIALLKGQEIPKETYTEDELKRLTARPKQGAGLRGETGRA